MLVAFGFWLHAVVTSRRLRDILLVPLSANHQGCLAPRRARRDIDGTGWLDVLSERQPALERALPMVSRPPSPRGSRCAVSPGAGSATKTTPSQRWHNAEVMLLVVVMGVAPGVGFTRLACRMQDTKGMESWLESARHSWDARRLRVLGSRERTCQQPEDQRAAADDRGDPHPWTLADRDEPAYSYLTQIERMRLVRETPAPDLPGSAAGQSIVRYVLTWTPFLTKTTRQNRE